VASCLNLQKYKTNDNENYEKKIARVLILWLITSFVLSGEVAAGATSYSGQVYNLNAATLYANTW
jgi:hypothetical protein